MKIMSELGPPKTWMSLVGAQNSEMVMEGNLITEDWD